MMSDPMNSSAVAYEARQAMGNGPLITSERMMPPKPTQVDILNDFTPTMEELAILGRIQPHGFLIAVEEFPPGTEDTRPPAVRNLPPPTPLKQVQHITNALAIDTEAEGMAIYDPDPDDMFSSGPDSSRSSGSSGSPGSSTSSSTSEDTITPPFLLYPLTASQADGSKAKASTANSNTATMPTPEGMVHTQHAPLSRLNNYIKAPRAVGGTKSPTIPPLSTASSTTNAMSTDEISAPPTPIDTPNLHRDSNFIMRVVSHNVQHLVAEPASSLLGSPLGVLLGFEQLRRLRQDLSVSHALSDLNPWPCILHVRREVIAESTGVQDVLRDRLADRRRVDKLAKESSATPGKGYHSPPLAPGITSADVPKIFPPQTPSGTPAPVTAAEIETTQPVIVTQQDSSSTKEDETDPIDAPKILSPELALNENQQVSHTQDKLAQIGPKYVTSPTHQASSSPPAIQSPSNLTVAAPPTRTPSHGSGQTQTPAPTPMSGNPAANHNPNTQPGQNPFANPNANGGGNPFANANPGGNGNPYANGNPQVGGGGGGSGPPANFTLPPPRNPVQLPFPPIPEPFIPTYSGPLLAQRFDVIFHRSGGLLVMEFEPAPMSEPRARTMANFRRQALRSINRVQHASSYEDLLARCADEVRYITGYDRVMVYKFHEDGCGEVVSESKTSAFELDSFFGLMYPANDVPVPARQLYIRNKFRQIGDVAFRGLSLVPQINPFTSTPFDLSNSLLRSVHPIHIQYLRNMGVRSSMSISIVIGGELWGLIACHHYRSSRYLDHETRLVAEQVGDLMASQIPHQIQRHHLAQLTILRSDLGTISTALTSPSNHHHQWADILRSQQDALLRLFSATGVTIHTGGRVIAVGQTPPSDFVLRLASFVLSNGQPSKLFSSNHLSKIFPQAAEHKNVASGILAIILSGKDGELMIVYRPEIISTITFGGKPTDDLGQEHLTPRNSFAVWTQLKVGQSQKWSQTTLQIAEEFARLMMEVKLIFFYQDEQQQEKARLILSEEIRRKQTHFIDKICHEIRNPLNGIFGSLTLIRDEIKEMDTLLQAAARFSTGSLTPSGTPTPSTPLPPSSAPSSSSLSPIAYSSPSGSVSLSNFPSNPVTRVYDHLREVVSNLNNIEVCAQHQKVIADDVLGLSKLEQNRVELDEAPFNVITCVQQALAMYQANIKIKKLYLATRFEVDAKHQYVKGDPFRLRQILTNIISNSIKFTETGGITVTLRVLSPGRTTDDEPMDDDMPDDGNDPMSSPEATPKLPTRSLSARPRVPIAQQIRAQEEAAEFELAITDTGIGISEASLANLFKPYAQASARVSAVYQGSGLGLCISRELARLMGGDVTITSRLGVGSTCRVTFLALPMSSDAIAEWKSHQANLGEPIDDSDMTAMLSTSPSVDHPMDGIELERRLSSSKMSLDTHMEVDHADNSPATGSNWSSPRGSATPVPNSQQATTTENVGNIYTPASVNTPHGTPPLTVPVLPTSSPGFTSSASASAAASTLARSISSASSTKSTPNSTPKARTSTIGVSPSKQEQWKPRVLIMEDNVINMKVLRRILETLGCICSSAFNGVEGVTQFSQQFQPPYTNAFDIVASDLEMPLMNGLEAIRTIRSMEVKARAQADMHANSQQHSNESNQSALSSPSSSPSPSPSPPPSVMPLHSNPPAPCYMLCISGNVRAEFVDAARECGADEYVGKPVSKDSLRAAITAARKKQQHWHETQTNGTH